MDERPIATFKVSESGQNGDLRIYTDRIERSNRTAFRKNAGLSITPFSRVSSVSLKRHALRQEVRISSGSTVIAVRVYGDAGQLVRLLNDGMAGRLESTPSVVAPVVQLPPAGWYLDPTGGGQQRWWDGSQWTTAVAATK